MTLFHFFTVSSLLFKILFTGYWLHNLTTFLLRTFVLRWGPVRAAGYFVSTLIRMSMFMVTWILLFLAPYPLSSVPMVSLIWLIVVFSER